MYSLKILTGQEVADFGELTFPYYRSVVRDMSHSGRMVAIGAVLVWESVGLILAELKESSRKAVICSIAVAPQQRRIGIATALLQRVQYELIARGCRLAEVIYMSERPSTAAVEGLLRKNGWPAANSRLMICTSDFTLLSQAPWMRQTDFPPEFEVFQWTDLAPRERTEILERQEQGPWFSDVLSPFAHEDNIDPSCSLGLRHSGRVVGWCINHQHSADTLRCGSLFVSKEFEVQGRAIGLLARSIYATRNTGRPNFIFDVSFQRPRMIQFVQRRMAPYLKSIQITKESCKTLTKEARQHEAS